MIVQHAIKESVKGMHTDTQQKNTGKNNNISLSVPRGYTYNSWYVSRLKSLFNLLL